MRKKKYENLNEYLCIIKGELSNAIEDKSEIHDIIAELEGHILEKAEICAPSKPEAKGNIEKVLQEFGDPLQIAKDYVKIYNKQNESSNIYQEDKISYYNMYDRMNKKRSNFKIFILITSILLILGVLGLVFIDILFGLGTFEMYTLEESINVVRNK